MNSFSQKFFKLWFSPVDSLRLDIFRAFIGLSLLLYMRFRWVYAEEWLTEKGYHLSPAYDPYFETVVPLLREPWLSIFGIVFFLSIGLFTIGWKTRWTALSTLLCLLYVSAADPLAFFSPNKVLICILAVFVFATPGRGWFSSVPPQFISAWPLRTLQAFCIIHLFTAGTSKIIFGEWLYNPYILWTQIQGNFCTDFAAFLLQYLPVKAWAFLQLMSLLFELLSPALFLIRPLRGIGIIWGIIFQLMIALTMQHLIYFNLILVSFYVLFTTDLFWYKLLKPKVGRSL